MLSATRPPGSIAMAHPLCRLVLVVLTCAWSVSAWAQSPLVGAGFAPGRDTHTVLPYEHVDPMSGNLVLVTTDLVLPGNAGLDLVVQRVYNSKIHPRYEHGDLTPEERSWVGLGWRLHFGRVINPTSLVSGETKIEFPDGSRHPLYQTTAFPEGWMTRGFARYDRTTHTLKLPNGLVYTFGHVAAANGLLGVARYVTQIADPFGNTLSFAYFSAPGPTDGVSQITQDLGAGQQRVVTFTFDPATNTLATMHYGARRWQFHTAPSGVPGHVVSIGVWRPDNYGDLAEFAYTYGMDGALPGELTVVKAPSQGRILFAYGDHHQRVAQRSVRTRVVTSRSTAGDVAPGTWTFAYGTGPHLNETVVETPCGSTTYRFVGIGTSGPFNAWSAGLLAERTVREGVTVLEQEINTWNVSSPISPDPIPGEPDGTWADAAVYNPLRVTRVVQRGPRSWRTTYAYSPTNFNDYGHPSTVSEYDESNLVARVRTYSYATGFTPHLVGRVAAASLTLGSETGTDTFTYHQGNGFLTSQVVAGLETTFQATARGSVWKVIDGRGNTTRFEYAWGAVSEIHTPLVTTTRTINQDGTTAKERVGGLETTYYYDSLMRVTHILPPSTTGLQVNQTVISRDPFHDNWFWIFRRENHHDNPAQYLVLEQALDGFGRPGWMRGPTDVQAYLVRDACGRVTFESLPYPHPGDSRGGVTTTYDALGRVTSVTEPGTPAATTTFTYSGIDVVKTDAAGRTTRYDYRAFGDPSQAQLVEVTDALAQKTTYQYNLFGALTRASGPGAGGPVRQWTYHHTTEHGTTSRLQSFTEPESGTTEYGPYDLAGNLTRVVTPTGHEITFGYDANNRLTSRTTADPAANLFIAYDALGRVSEQRRGAAQSPDEVRTSFGYDAVGRVVSRQDALDGRTFTSTLTYDAWNRVTGLTYPRPAGQTGRQVGYEYDAQWRLSRVTNDEVAFATGFTYTHGALTRYVTGLVQHDVTFDARDRVSGLRSGVVNAPVPALELSYTYDATNQVSAIDDLREGYEQTFQYDALGRLTQATGPYPTLQWAYDAMGNRTWEQRGAAQTTYTYPAATRRLTQVSGAVSENFTYDAAGRVTQDAVGTYAYRPTGELATATTPSAVAAYQYDAEGWRIKRTVGGTTTYTLRSLGQQTLSHFELRCGVLVWTRDDVYGAGRLLGAVRRGPTAVTLQLESTSSSVNEGAGTAAVGVKVTTSDGTALTCPVSVSVAAVGGTAQLGVDFTAPAGTLTFPSGTASGTVRWVSVPILEDAIDEPDETFSVLFSAPSGASWTGPTTHTVTIVDNDPPAVVEIQGDVTVPEAGGAAVFTIKRTGLTAFAVRVSYQTADGTALVATGDYQVRSGTVEIPPGGHEATQTVSVAVTNDAWAEPNETFTVTLSAPVHATLGTAVGTATIVDDDGPYVALNLGLSGVYLADVPSGPGAEGYVLLGNPQGSAVTARLTFIPTTGGARVRDVVLGAWARTTVHVGSEPGIAGRGLVSVAVQSATPGTVVDAEHATYWSDGWAIGRSTEGVAPASTWSLAEGAVGGFEAYLAVFNLEPVPVRLALTFYRAGAAPVVQTRDIPAGPGRTRLTVRDLGVTGDHGTRVVATRLVGGAPAAVVVERTQTWDGGTPWAAHSTPGVAALSPTWHFAEGVTSADAITYLALVNPSGTATTATVTYRHANGATYQATVAVPAERRVTLATPSWVPAGSHGITVTTSPMGIVAERMVYGGPSWAWGHAGVASPVGATAWRFAEGATGWFETYFLVTNPTGTGTTASFAFRTDSGATASAALWVPAGSRATLLANAVPGLGSASFRTAVTASQALVVERVTYWPSGGLLFLGGGGVLALDTGPPGEAFVTALEDRTLRELAESARLATREGLPYTGLVEATPLGPVSEARAAGLVSAEELAAREAAAVARAAAAMPGDVTLSGVTTSSAGWYGAHLTLGRRP
jgi:YD repeat-containing protein